MVLPAAGTGREFFFLGAVKHGRQRIRQCKDVFRGHNLKMAARKPVEGNTAVNYVSPIPPPQGTELITDEDIHRVRISAESVGCGDSEIVIVEPGHLRRL